MKIVKRILLAVVTICVLLVLLQSFPSDPL